MAREKQGGKEAGKRSVGRKATSAAKVAKTANDAKAAKKKGAQPQARKKPNGVVAARPKRRRNAGVPTADERQQEGHRV